MRRFVSLLFAVCLALTLTATAYADGMTTYHLDELGMSIDIPSEYVVFTRDIDENDPNLSAYSLTKDLMRSLMEQENIYLEVWDRDFSFELKVSMMDSPFDSYNQFSDDILLSLVALLEEQFQNSGISVTGSRIQTHSQTKFLEISMSQDLEDGTVYGRHFNTVYNGKAINITLHSYAGPISLLQAAELLNIVDSIRFDEAPAAAPAATPAPTAAAASGSTYTDSETGVTFPIPAGWNEKPLSKEREFLDAKFTADGEIGVMILYGSTDIYGREDFQSLLTAAEKVVLSREDLDNSLIPMAELAQEFGWEEKDVSRVTYGGKEYFYVEPASAIPVVYLTRFENGWMYQFQFYSGSGSPYFEDLVSMISSAVYPSSSQPSSAVTPARTGSLFSGILLSLVVTILIYSVPILIYRYAIRKRPVEKKKAKSITIVYGIVAFLLMSALLYSLNGSGAAGGAILLWSWVNYRVLIGGKGPDESQEAPSPESDDAYAAPEVRLDPVQPFEPDKPEPDAADVPPTVPGAVYFCRMCGAKLPDGAKFCAKCGTKVI